MYTTGPVQIKVTFLCPPLVTRSAFNKQVYIQMQAFVKYQDDVGQSLNQGFELSLYEILNIMLSLILF